MDALSAARCAAAPPGRDAARPRATGGSRPAGARVAKVGRRGASARVAAVGRRGAFARVAALLLVVAALVGCGSDAGSAGADPAGAIPAGASAYVEVVLEPSEEVRAGADAAARKLLRTSDPRSVIERWLADKTDGELSWDRDVAPWAGDRAGLAALPGAGHATRGIAAIAADDREAAKTTLERLLQQEGPTRELKHRGVTLEIDADGDGFAVAGDYALLGREAELKRAIDVVEGDAEGLASLDRYEDALDGLPEGRLGHAYLDPRALWEAADRAGALGGPAQQLGGLLRVEDLAPTAMALTADAETVAVESLTAKDGLGALADLAKAPPDLVGELPQDAWLAFGVADVGATARTLIGEVGGALGASLIYEQVRSATGLDLERDVLSWVGDVAGFVAGTDEASVRGGLVIAVTDPDRAAAAFGRLVALAGRRTGSTPAPVRIAGAESAFALELPENREAIAARSEDRVVLSLGRAAAEAALGRGGRLSETPEWSRARAALGDDVQPSFLLAMNGLIPFLDAVNGNDPEWEAFKPHLAAVTVAAAGMREDGDRLRGRGVLALE